MEIIDFMRMARRRLWIIVLVPLLAGGAVLASQVLQPKLFSSSAVVATPALVGGSSDNTYNGSQGVLQYVSAFQGAATSAVIVQKVAVAADLKPAYVNDHLLVVSTGTSSIMRVTFVTANKQIADDVARDVATKTLGYLFGSQVRLAQRQVDSAQSVVDDLNQQLTAIGAKAGTVSPDQLYQTKQQQLVSLRETYIQQRAAGNSSGAATAASDISAVQRSLTTLTPFVTEYLAVAHRRDAAQTLQTSLQLRLSAAKSQAEAADPASVITMTATHLVSRVPLILLKVLPAVGSGLFLAVLIVVALELLARRGRETDHRARNGLGEDGLDEDLWLSSSRG